ncbi:hypothetical protein [Actinomadura harenae]|uniref:Uncharacterized protein n=1 Tax=Actinomadura harenae TaxID=2483351 RepID=A0A3M2L9Q0_9ACTN|nr:hypothetical protein [Actinomadura harenae]RMI33776.1 hypothetical protein EBO15_41390 [Actinomadura harenae]
MNRRAQHAPADHAAAVVTLLRDEGGFAGLADPATAAIIRDSITRHLDALTAGQDDAGCECIVDDPSVAHWELKDAGRRGPVRLGCYRWPMSDAAQQREDDLSRRLGDLATAHRSQGGPRG